MSYSKKKVFVAGHNGMVGSAIYRLLESDPTLELVAASRSELNLLSQDATADFFEHHKFDEVYMAAAKVGGIRANSTKPAEFIFENLSVQNNVIYSAWSSNVTKLLFLGSSCIYPKFAPQPIPEEALLSGDLEPTNSAYAVAKISGLQLCKNFNQQYGTDYRAVMPTNLYGPNDNFHKDNSHVLPALLKRFHDAKLNSDENVTVWGSGNPRREFMHVEDMAKGCIHVMNLDKEKYYSSVLPEYQYFNIGTGSDVSIKQLALLIAEVVGYRGEISFDTSQPDGTPRKLLDVKRIESTNWAAKIELSAGIADTFDWYLKNEVDLRV